MEDNICPGPKRVGKTAIGMLAAATSGKNIANTKWE